MRRRACSATISVGDVAFRHAGLHRGAELRNFVKLLGVGERVIDAFAGGLENGFLVNGIRLNAKFPGRLAQHPGRSKTKAARAKVDAGDQLAAGRIT